MLVSDGQGIMPLEVTFKVSQITRVVRSSHVRLCSLFFCAEPHVCSAFSPFPSLPSLMGGFGKCWVGKYLY